MKNRKIIAVTGIVLILAVLGVYKFATRTKPPVAAPDVNFTEFGNLIFGNPGFKADTWYLIYEKPGSAAESAELKFDSDSVCLGGVCPGGIAIGERVKVEGIATTSIVLVRRLTTDISTSSGQSVALFFYNPLNDRFPGSNNIQCSPQGLTPVTRIIPKTNTPIQNTVNLLLRGVLSPAEKQSGIVTEFPLDGLKLTGASLKDGILTLSFDDPQNRTSGGSCRSGILWFQIEATAKQFPGVNEVHFSPSTLFQP
jgi:hypothetical protein